MLYVWVHCTLLANYLRIRGLSHLEGIHGESPDVCRFLLFAAPVDKVTVRPVEASIQPTSGHQSQPAEQHHTRSDKVFATPKPRVGAQEDQVSS